MNTFEECPHCGNRTDGHGIWKCEDCGLVICMGCDDPDNGHCPKCNGYAKKIGYIE